MSKPGSNSSDRRRTRCSYGILKQWGLLLCLLLGTGCEILEMQEPSPVRETPLLEPNLLESISRDLEDDHWQPNPSWSPTTEWENREPHGPAAGSLRWRYASKSWQETVQKLRDALALQNQSPPQWTDEDLLAELAKQETRAGWNAAILFAQRVPHRAGWVEPLLKRLALNAVLSQIPESEGDPKNGSRSVSQNVQAAAAEAWCLVLASRAADPTDALEAPAIALLDFYLPENVRGEFYRGIGRWVPPTNVPGLDEALPSQRGEQPTSMDLREAAMEACVLYALWNREALNSADVPDSALWPATLLEWQWEPNSHFESNSTIRLRFLHWLVLTQHPNAAKVLETHLIDGNPDVRDAALIHLGALKTPEALKTLQTHAKRPEPRVRAMAVKGLAHWGVPYLIPFLEDESHEVRLSVAEELSRFPTAEAAIWLQKLQADASRQVETAALEATRSWPDEFAIPVLLHGMEHASPLTRGECFRELRRRTGIEDSFPVTAGPEVRQAAIARLAREWNLPWQLVATNPTAPPDTKINRLRVAELQAYLLDVINPEFSEQSARHLMAVRTLKESSPLDVPAIETFVWEQSASPRTKVILEEILPTLSPVYAALRELQTQDLGGRRIAANHLRMQAESQSLSPLAVRWLREILKEESDSLVWRMALYAVLPDFNPETVQLVIWAANHPDAGIRHLACEFATRHKSPDFADWLLPLLHDSETSVQLAAIQAAGVCRNRIVIHGLLSKNTDQSLPGLRQLLADEDVRVSVEAAIAMSRLGDPEGHDELIRLTHHPDPRIREQVILAMGQTGQSRFVDSLIGLGWTAKDVRIQAAVLKSLASLVPPANQPAQLAEATGLEDKIQVWATWWDERRNLRQIR